MSPVIAVPSKEAQILHNQRRRLGRRNEAYYWENWKVLSGVVSSFDPYEDHIIQVRDELNALLELWFETPLMCDENGKAARLLYNDLDGPLIHLGPGRQGKSEAKAVIECLSSSASVIAKSSVCSDDQLPPEVALGVKNLLSAIPFPLSLLVEGDWPSQISANEALNFLTKIRSALSDQLAIQPSGNARAFRTALALRAAYEFYTGKPITVSHDPDYGISGGFCRCLSEVFEITGLQPKVIDLASRAKKTEETHPLLSKYRNYFWRPLGKVGHHPVLFTKVGWVENMTFREKSLNLIAMKCSRLEFLQCYNICSKGRVYTTTATGSLTSSRLVRSVHNGAIETLARLF